jgi:hypothetical protein
MFREPPRPSSWAYNCINSLVITSQTTTNKAVTTNTRMVKPEAVNAVVSSCWWAWRRQKHVEPNINLQVINLWISWTYLFDLLNCMMRHGLVNFKFHFRILWWGTDLPTSNSISVFYDEARTCQLQIKFPYSMMRHGLANFKFHFRILWWGTDLPTSN